MKPEKHKKQMSKKTKIIITISIILALLVGSVVFGYFYVRSKIYSNSDISDITTEDSFEEVPGITNILLIGTDARDLNERARSDSIIIATIDNNTKKLKLSSIMRDTFVDIPGYGEQKINAALALGGPELLMKTIKENFDFTLDKYVMVNFWGFEDIIDGIGGIEVDVKDYEIPEINKFIGEVRDVKSPPLTTPGLQHLDGQQALAYARIRKVGNGSYERTERQRRVLDIVAEKMMDVSVVKYPGLLYDLLPSVKTNIEPLTLLNYAYTVSKFGELKFEQLQIPATELSQGGLYRNKGWVLLIDKEQNGKILNDFIYNDKPYSSEDVDKAHFKSVMADYNALNNEYKQQHGEPAHIEENDDELDKIKNESGSGSTNGGNQGSNSGSTNGGSQGGNSGGTNGGSQGGNSGGANGGSQGGNSGGTDGGSQGGNSGGTDGGSQGGNSGGTDGGSQGGNSGGTDGESQGGTDGGNQDSNVDETPKPPKEPVD
ncbi:MAG: LCP family protein [Clostridium sp.]|uniref:LCP family protein n=1 Tax=Clostridium sp. TaxID=1506 RepID=UPI0025C66A55|nr:LCP family protein [Clostridium sp.]MBS5928387.1 LCP family protein [Clostridium sp.]